MIFTRRYLQYNNLVFDGFDMISDFNSEASFKGSSTEYSFGHGSYRPFKSKFLFVRERTVNMTITLKLKKLPCEYREYYVQYALSELARPGILWSIKNGELLWAVAVTENVAEVINHRKDIFELDVNFIIPGGIWHKADKQKTFLLPYDVCLFMECKGYRTLQPCVDSVNGDCCESCRAEEIASKANCFCCCVDEITEDMALCYHLDDLQSFYTCDTQYQIMYDCEKAERFNKEKHLGQKICSISDCDGGIIAGQFYSETDIPTGDVTVVIDGNMKNPWIEINGNANVIEGEYNGTLIIEPTGDVYFQKNDCCDPTLLSPSVWTVPKGNVYGWTVEPGDNRLIIKLNECCGVSCAYIQHDAITL